MEIGVHTLAFSTTVNAGLVYSKGRAIVVDTMYGPAQAAQIKQAAEERNLKVEYVFNTHMHFDHTAGNSTFDAPVIASDACRDSMKQWYPEKIREMMRNSSHIPADFRITAPSVSFSQSMLVEVGGLPVKFELYGGHTPGSSIAIVEKDGVIFAGDLLFVGRYPYVGNASIADWCAALRRLMDVSKDFRIVVPGHGRLLTGPAIRGEMGALLSFLESTLGTASRLVSMGVPKEEALKYPGFPWIATDQSDAGVRRAQCIERAYDEVAQWGRRPL